MTSVGSTSALTSGALWPEERPHLDKMAAEGMRFIS